MKKNKLIMLSFALLLSFAGLRAMNGHNTDPNSGREHASWSSLWQLLRKPFDNLYEQSNFRERALWEACAAGDLGGVKGFFEGRLLLSELTILPVNINALDEYGRSPLMWAALGGHGKVVKYLLRHGADTRHSANQSALHRAIVASCYVAVEKCKKILDHCKKDDQNYESALKNYNAVCEDYERRKKVVEILVAYKADLNAVRYVYVNGYDFAQKLSPVSCAVLENDVYIVGLLLKKGAFINASSDDDGRTPLHFAALKGNAEMVKYLVQRGANVCRRTNKNAPSDTQLSKDETWPSSKTPMELASKEMQKDPVLFLNCFSTPYQSKHFEQLNQEQKTDVKFLFQ